MSSISILSESDLALLGAIGLGVVLWPALIAYLFWRRGRNPWIWLSLPIAWVELATLFFALRDSDLFLPVFSVIWFGGTILLVWIVGHLTAPTRARRPLSR